MFYVAVVSAYSTFTITDANSYDVGDTATNPIYVDTHLKFRTPIVSEITNGVAFQGLAYRAVYGDLAEYYRSDKAYDPGTLIVIGSGPAEITLARGECNGIISEYPGYELGEKKDEKDYCFSYCYSFGSLHLRFLWCYTQQRPRSSKTRS